MSSRPSLGTNSASSPSQLSSASAPAFVVAMMVESKSISVRDYPGMVFRPPDLWCQSQRRPGVMTKWLIVEVTDDANRPTAKQVTPIRVL